MRVFGKINIIGLDNGYGNIKTANGIFPASVTCCEAEPAHAQDVLVYDGKYYVIGAGHREFTLDKVGNQDHYLLTLAGIGQELWCNQLTTAAVHLAVGLPLTWVGDQREQFRAYLSQNRHVDFNWRGIDYHVDLVGVDVYAQGYSAVISELRKFTGANMLCDIGNGTMIVMAINDRKPVLEQCFTEKYGTYQCVLKAREALTRLCGRTVPDVTIEQVMREGTADAAPEYVQVIREAAADYAAEIMRKLREHEYDPKTMRLWIVGGGGCLIRNFGQYDPNRVTIIGDIHASAKGYEYLAERRLLREARARGKRFCARRFASTRRNPPTGRRCGCCVKCGRNSTCAMRMLSWRRSMHTMGKRGKAASIISSGRKSAALSAKRWQHHPRLCSTCFDVLGKHRQRHRRTRTRRTRPISTICWI